MGRLLIVEDDDFFAQALRGILEDNGHEVAVAENGKAAVQRLLLDQFDCVLSDVQMPVMSGIELAKWIQINKPVPLILMTGYSEAVNTQQALKEYATDLLIKPFSDEEVMRVVRRILEAPLAPSVNGASTTTDILKPSEEFAKVPTYALMQGGTADFNLYDFSSGTLVKVVSRGEIYTPNMDVIRKNKFLYTEKENLSKLMAMTILVAKAAGKSDKVDPLVKAEIVERAIEITLQKVSAFGLNAKLVDDCVDMMACYLEAFDDSVLLALIQRLGETSNSRFGHTLATTAIALLVAHRRGVSIEQCFVLAAAGIFHDIGMGKINPQLLQTPPPLLKMRERAEIEHHVEFGVEILRKSGVVGSEVCEVILQHHENQLGTGYPRRLKGDQIRPLARILHVVDDFCSLIGEKPNLRKLSVAKAIAQLIGNGRFDQTIANDLKAILNSAEEKACA